MRRSKAVLEDITGSAVLGFRAPSFSVVPDTRWALDVLLEEGYEYDSSVVPVSQHPQYGYPDTPRDAYRVQCPSGTIVELPPATVRAMGSNFPAGGGAYLRLLPLWLVRGALRDAERRGRPGVFYIHPWELDDHVPEIAMSRQARVRTFAGRRRTWPRVSALLTEFRFERIDCSLDRVDAEPISLP